MDRNDLTEWATSRTEDVLRDVLQRHYARDWQDLSRDDLIEELSTYVMHGVENPVATMSREELVDAIWNEVVEPILEDGSLMSEELDGMLLVEGGD